MKVEFWGKLKKLCRDLQVTSPKRRRVTLGFAKKRYMYVGDFDLIIGGVAAERHGFSKGDKVRVTVEKI